MEEDPKPSPSHQVHVKEGKIAIANAVDRRLLIFDSRSGEATIVDHEAKRAYALGQEMLEDLAEDYLETQRKVLSEMERQVDELPANERAGLQRILEMLHKEIDAATSGAKTRKDLWTWTEIEVSVNGTKARKGRLNEGTTDEEQLWVATDDQELLTREERSQFSALDQFFQKLAETLPRGLREDLGDLRFLAPDGSLVLRREQREGDPPVSTRLEILQLDRKEVEAGWFSIPAGFEEAAVGEPSEREESGSETAVTAPK